MFAKRFFRVAAGLLRLAGTYHFSAAGVAATSFDARQNWAVLLSVLDHLPRGKKAMLVTRDAAFESKASSGHQR